MKLSDTHCHSNDTRLGGNMNSLTKFIDQSLALHSDPEALTQGEVNKVLDSTQYEVIENEVLMNSDIEGLSISGSLFSLTTFKNVTFKSCVFFGSKIENCRFVGCNFVDCDFQFTNIAFSNFIATNFENCKWECSPLKKSEFNHCGMDTKTLYFVAKEDNVIESCFMTEEVEWVEAPLNEDGKQDPTKTMNVLLSHFGKKAA
ncbi:MAG: hypothetical protein CME70_08610 [Halobacteriovorax sp.]|nr:hypothetical protein [Halobacteriovorax sp.]|tara:strand:+ start:120056 stop:120661 length:606 start_codon:yes stop_codon:yes gene_type:complete